MKKKSIIGLLVEDRPGVMQRVSGLFNRRGFNIETIAVGKSEKQGMSRITMTVIGDDKVIEQVIKQVNKLVDVVKVSQMGSHESVIRELCLIKLHTKNSEARNQITNFAEIFRGRIVDVSPNSLTIEIVGDSKKVDAFIELVRVFGVKEMARTGVVAIGRG